MLLKDRLIPEIKDQVFNPNNENYICLPLFLEEWMEKDITPIQLPLEIATNLYWQIYPTSRFDYLKYLLLFT